MLNIIFSWFPFILSFKSTIFFIRKFSPNRKSFPFSLIRIISMIKIKPIIVIFISSFFSLRFFYLFSFIKNILKFSIIMVSIDKFYIRIKKFSCFSCFFINIFLTLTSSSASATLNGSPFFLVKEKYP